MARHLFGLTAQNFDETIFDTEDLSTVRGGSIAAIEAIGAIADNLVGLNGLEPVSIGGSTGIWIGEAVPGFDMEKPDFDMEKIEPQNLKRAAGHMCFASASQPCGESFLADKDALLASLARIQMSAAGTTYPAEAGTSVCPADLVRPVATQEMWYGGSRRPLSQAVLDRRAYGLTAKQDFLIKLAGGSEGHRIFDEPGLVEGAAFAMLLSSVSEAAAPPEGLKPNLHDKIAVIHFDANHAGSAERTSIEKASDYDGQVKAQKEFDGRLAELRSGLTRAILDVLLGSNGLGKPGDAEAKLRVDIRKQADRIIRFEALLWAGDEMTFIVPARLGWTATRAMLDYLDGFAPIAGQKLTGAIGLVYCHHDAPIARIRSLAEELCNFVKSVDREHSQVFPLVLESFDHIGRGIDDFVAKRTPQKASLTKEDRAAFYLLDLASMADVQKLASEWAVKKSRRQVKKEAIDGHRGAAPFSQDVRKTMLVEEYWDYLVPVRVPVHADGGEHA